MTGGNVYDPVELRRAVDTLEHKAEAIIKQLKELQETSERHEKFTRKMELMIPSVLLMAVGAQQFMKLIV